jgi:hypothetical protein
MNAWRYIPRAFQQAGDVMPTRSGNYAAFYVAPPFDSSALGAHATPDFRYYNQLKMWKGADNAFPFVDSHDKTYQVRDDSDWEKTLLPRLRERLRASKNIVLFLSDTTRASKALVEELDYGICTEKLPIIIVYPELKTLASLRTGEGFSKAVTNLWEKVPVFKKSMDTVPTLHVPMLKEVITKALNNADFMLATKKGPGKSYYPHQ